MAAGYTPERYRRHSIRLRAHDYGRGSGIFTVNGITTTTSLGMKRNWTAYGITSCGTRSPGTTMNSMLDRAQHRVCRGEARLALPDPHANVCHNLVKEMTR